MTAGWGITRNAIFFTGQGVVSGVILSGGASRRMGQDKGLAPFAGLPLIQHVIARIAPQVDELHISIHRQSDEYRQFGYPLVADANTEFQGPLAGVLAGLKASRYEWVVTAPCDTPFLPADLVARLLASADGADLVVASTERAHATTMLCRRSLADSLAAALAQGVRRVQDWQAEQRCVLVHFDDETAFANLNTPEQLANALKQERRS
ncbi:MAG TPA: molybdenum cofactor guanylyltransferase MobA [Burkholderiales bacterium]|nr:molybdenum cofactor guanylyltransferase MobA [Burkholderiales bacterium]